MMKNILVKLFNLDLKSPAPAPVVQETSSYAGAASGGNLAKAQARMESAIDGLISNPYETTLVHGGTTWVLDSHCIEGVIKSAITRDGLSVKISSEAFQHRRGGGWTSGKENPVRSDPIVQASAITAGFLNSISKISAVPFDQSVDLPAFRKAYKDFMEALDFVAQAGHTLPNYQKLIDSDEAILRDGKPGYRGLISNREGPNGVHYVQSQIIRSRNMALREKEKTLTPFLVKFGTNIKAATECAIDIVLADELQRHAAWGGVNYCPSGILITLGAVLDQVIAQLKSAELLGVSTSAFWGVAASFATKAEPVPAEAKEVSNAL